jgi:hypothetical protein
VNVVVDANHAQYVYKEKVQIFLSLTSLTKTGKDVSVTHKSKLSLQSSELVLPHHITSHAGECVPPFWFWGRAHWLGIEGVGGPNSIEGTNIVVWYSLCI